MEIVRIDDDVTAFVTPVPVPGLGVLPVNAFLLRTPDGAILVDTCVTQPRGEFLEGVATVVDPSDIRWIWLTHPDRDHTGGLLEMLDAAPRARLMANFTSIGHLLVGPEPVALDRVHVVNAGERVQLGDTEVHAFRPPLFDNPGTVGFFEPRRGIMISSDCFGAPVSTMEEAIVPDAAALRDDDRIAAQLMWGSADSPWVHAIDKAKFATSLDSIRQLDPALVLSTHIPPIHGNIEPHLETLARLPDSAPAVGPDQAALEAMLAEMEPTAV